MVSWQLIGLTGGVKRLIFEKMKVLRAILYLLGIVWILLIIVSLINREPAPVPTDTAARTGYYFGYYLTSLMFFVPGLVFILLARRISKRLRRKKDQELVDSLPFKSE